MAKSEAQRRVAEIASGIAGFASQFASFHEAQSASLEVKAAELKSVAHSAAEQLEEVSTDPWPPMVWSPRLDMDVVIIIRSPLRDG